MFWLACLLSFLLLFALSVWLGVRSVNHQPLLSRPALMRVLASRSVAMSMLIVFASALLLYGCGTARSPALMSRPIPADLLTPPSKPVLLIPASASPTPGPTTTSTPRAAPSTESDTAR